MSLLTSQDLAAMRSVLEESFPDTAVIQTSAFTSDSGGGGTVGWTASGTVACRVAPMSGDEQVTGDRLSAEGSWIITLPANTSIAESSRLVVGPTTFEVEAVRGPRSYELSRRVEANKVS